MMKRHSFNRKKAFISGMGSIIEFNPRDSVVSNKINAIKERRKRNMEAMQDLNSLKSDWYEVGASITHAMKVYDNSAHY